MVGGVVQAGGFVLALHAASTLRREEIPDQPSLMSQAATGARRRGVQLLVLLRLREQRGVQLLVLLRLREQRGEPVLLSATGQISFGGSANATTKRGGPLEPRVEILEADLQALEAKQSEDHEMLAQRIDGVREEMTAAEERQESRRPELLGRSVFREEAGVWVFIFGLLVSTVGVLV